MDAAAFMKLVSLGGAHLLRCAEQDLASGSVMANVPQPALPDPSKETSREYVAFSHLSGPLLSPRKNRVGSKVML